MRPSAPNRSHLTLLLALALVADCSGNDGPLAGDLELNGRITVPAQ